MLNKRSAQGVHLSLARPKLQGKVPYDHSQSHLQERGLLY